MQRLLLALTLCAGLPMVQSVWAQRAPTIVVDIHQIGFDEVERLKREPSVLFSVELGNKLLLGVQPEHHSQWLSRARTRDGGVELMPEEVAIRDHACLHQSVQKADLLAGGFEILKQPPASILYQVRAGLPIRTVPADGVVARELANEPAPVAAMAERASVSEIVTQVDAERWFSTMSTLATFNRNSYSPTLAQAHNWIRDRFAAFGLATQSFRYTLSNITSCSPTPPPIDLDNPIGVKLGSVRPNEWIVVGAHYDSRNTGRCDGTQAPQPGANDNASGCAGVLELAQIFAGIPTERSIYFMCYSGEEQGLVGSRRYVEALQANGEISKVKHMINLDMIGFAVDDSLSARIETRAPHGALLDIYAAAQLTYAPELNLIRSTNAAAASDHWWFLQAGVPAMFTWENGASIYPHYHLMTDLPENMTRARPLAAGIIKMDAAVLAELAVLVQGTPADLFENGFED